MDLILPPADDLERHAASWRLQEPAGLIGIVLLPTALLGQIEDQHAPLGEVGWSRGSGSKAVGWCPCRAGQKVYPQPNDYTQV